MSYVQVMRNYKECTYIFQGLCGGPLATGLIIKNREKAKWFTIGRCCQMYNRTPKKDVWVTKPGVDETPSPDKDCTYIEMLGPGELLKEVPSLHAMH